jgi:hypothetical protein
MGFQINKWAISVHRQKGICRPGITYTVNNHTVVKNELISLWIRQRLMTAYPSLYKQEVLGRTHFILSFDTTRTA